MSIYATISSIRTDKFDIIFESDWCDNLFLIGIVGVTKQTLYISTKLIKHIQKEILEYGNVVDYFDTVTMSDGTDRNYTWEIYRKENEDKVVMTQKEHHDIYEIDYSTFTDIINWCVTEHEKNEIEQEKHFKLYSRDLHKPVAHIVNGELVICKSNLKGTAENTVRIPISAEQLKLLKKIFISEITEEELLYGV